MKILVISNLYPPFYIGGYELACRNIVNGLIERGHEVCVLSTPSHTFEKTIPVSSVESSTVLRRLQLRTFQPINSHSEHVRNAYHLEAMVTNFTNTAVVLEVIKDFSPDCVYLFSLVGIGGLSIIDALNSLSISWVFHLMDRAPETLQFGISKSILSIFNAHEGAIYKQGSIISMSKHLIDEIETLCGFSFHGKFELIPGWADISKELIERKYGELGKLKFVTAGTVHPHKGIDIIVETASLLKKNSITNFTIDVYGDGNLGHYVDLAKQFGVSQFVRFLGPKTQAELIQIYKFSDAFLFPTWEREPFGFAPVEAAAVGCIPIITSTCGVAERLVGNVHCLKIDRTAHALFEVLRDFCQYKLDFTKLGRNAQAITREDLNFETCLDKIEGILKRVSISKGTNIPTWKDTNRAFLKHNLAVRLFS